MGMTKGNFRRNRWFNGDYRNRHRKKRGAKGLGVYALQPAGMGPSGVHVPSLKDQCKCGGCSGKRAAK